jgi:hypothetical protein
MYYVPSAPYDYYEDYDGSTNTYYYYDTINYAGKNNVLSPNRQFIAYSLIDTSAIPDTDVISSATLYLDEDDYVGSKGVTKDYYVQVWTGSTYTNLTNGSLTYDSLSPRTRSISLTSGELSYISKNGITLFRVSVNDPGSAKTRVLTIKSYDDSQSVAMRLDVTHAAPSSTRPQVI